MIEPQEPDFEGPCQLCGLEAGLCICPECPVCKGVGDPACYKAHGLTVSPAQIASRGGRTLSPEALIFLTTFGDPAVGIQGDSVRISGLYLPVELRHEFRQRLGLLFAEVMDGAPEVTWEDEI